MPQVKSITYSNILTVHVYSYTNLSIFPHKPTTLCCETEMLQIVGRTLLNLWQYNLMAFSCSHVEDVSRGQSSACVFCCALQQTITH